MAGGGKGGGKQVVTTRLDPGTRNFIQNALRPQARRGARVALQPGQLTPGLSGLQRRGINQLLRLDPSVLNRAGGGLLGGAEDLFGRAGEEFSGAALERFLNPELENVVGAVQSDFDRQREIALRTGAAEATKAGAFGGSRSGVLQSNLLGEVGRDESRTLAGLRSSAFDNAVDRFFGNRAQLGQLGAAQGGLGLNALGLGGQLGLSRAQGLFGFGETQRGITEAQRLNQIRKNQLAQQFLLGGIGIPGSTQTTPLSTDPFGSAAGGALAGFGIGGPIGAGIGGGLGLLGGLF